MGSIGTKPTLDQTGALCIRLDFLKELYNVTIDGRQDSRGLNLVVKIKTLKRKGSES